jgi:hypothetical protein
LQNKHKCDILKLSLNNKQAKTKKEKMSTETLLKNPLENAEGLSPVDRHRQLELGHKALRLEAREAKLDKQIQSTSTFNVSKNVRHGAAVVANGIDRKLNAQLRTMHYENNQDAYQEQAVKDAKAEGVETSFGTNPKD